MMREIIVLTTVAKAVAVLERLEAEIDSAATFQKLDAIIAEAKGIAAAARHLQAKATIGAERERVKGVFVRGGRIHTKAERKLGQKLKLLPKAKGTRGQIRGSADGSGDTVLVSPEVGDELTIPELGISLKRAAAAQKLAEISDEELERRMEVLAAADVPVAPGTVLNAKRKESKEQKRHNVAKAAFSADGPFGTVVIDPPWKVEKIDRDVRPNQDAFDYPTMTAEQIVVHFRDEIAPRLEPECHLFMWTTQKWLPQTFAIFDQIGFKYVFTMVWHKAGGFQPVGLPQYNCEFVVYGRRGSPVFIDTTDFPCCFEGARREHSRKPDRFYDIVRRVTGGSRIDVFSRESREGFAQYGNETAKFNEAAE